MTEETSAHVGRVGNVARAYWREEVLWVRIRTREGASVSVPWSWTDLPVIVPSETRIAPRLSRQALMDLMHHFDQAGQTLRRQSRKGSSR